MSVGDLDASLERAADGANAADGVLEFDVTNQTLDPLSDRATGRIQVRVECFCPAGRKH